MKLYNTLSRKIEDFQPIEAGMVKLYTCGPTVYHYAHIGNLRNIVFNDTLRRTLETTGYKVNHVMNITDVGHLASDADEGEDKLEKGAAREGKTVWEVAQFYIDAFNQHSRALNILPPTQTIRATDAVPAQIDMVKTLLEKGFAYQTKQAIYFDTSKLSDYGKLTGQKLSDKEVGVRSEVVTDKDKHRPQDFAIWFFTVGHFSDHQMRWESPWGAGFPGWHLECSAIIHQSLGEPIDIHTGGVDHIGTHHTNEIAQSEAAFGKPLSNYWLHHEFLQQDGGKMSKSSAKTITLDEVIKQGYDPLALRLFYLQSHYKSEANFSWENLKAAHIRLKNYRALADLRFQVLSIKNKHDIDYKLYSDNIKATLENDLDTPVTLMYIDKVSDLQGGILSKDQLENFLNFIKLIDSLLGLNLQESNDITENQKKMIDKREDARKAKEWAKSDELRAELEEQGIGLRDTEHGAIWYRI